MTAESARLSKPKTLQDKLELLSGSGQFQAGLTKLRRASAPFDDPSADAVLRTSDNVDFHVFRWFLKGMSPFFDDMFTLPQPPSSTSTDPIHMPEPSSVLEPLLRLHYPFPEPLTFSSFDDAKPVLAAAHKLQLSRIERVLHKAALPYVTENPLRVYGFALRHRMDDLVRLAAREFLAVKDFTTILDSDELDGLSVAAYRRLLIYRHLCVISIGSMLRSPRPWTCEFPQWTWLTCSYCVEHTKACETSSPASCRSECGTAEWFEQYMDRLCKALDVTPSAAVVRDSGLISEAIAAAYKTCRDSCKRLAYKHMHRYTEELAGRLDEIALQVSLEIK